MGARVHIGSGPTLTQSPVLAGPDGIEPVDPSAASFTGDDRRRPQARRARPVPALPVLPDALVRMGHTFTEPSGVEVQLSVTEDGGHFCAHSDATDTVHADRRMSYVLFVHREPQGFSGGDLHIDCRGSSDGLPDGWLDVAPVANRLVVFASRLVHEVTTVRVPSRAFEDGGFTVNGWVRW